MVKPGPKERSGVLEDWLLKDEVHNKSRVVAEGRAGAKLARLAYRELGESEGGYHLLEVDLHSGRHHQIRCQLAHIGCPVKGDLKYGAPRSNGDGSIGLHARSVRFEHPVSHEEVYVVAPNERIEHMFGIETPNKR